MKEANADRTAPLLDGRYRLGDCVGEGGMARVYRAEDVLLGRTVAIKMIRPGIDGASSERARSEMTVLASLNHPSLVTLFDASLVPGQPEYLAMEFVDGPTLSARLASGGALPPDVVGHLGSELAEALHVVHKAGVVHRDIKPSNVLLSPAQLPGARPRAKLADFGIAYLLDTSRITSPGLVIGTVAYLAPEQLHGDPPTPAADVYSLGLVLLEALTGKRAHPQGGGMAAAVARLESEPEIPASLGQPWVDLLTRMLRRDPLQRPTAADVASATGKLAQQAPAAGARASGTAVTVPLTAPTLIAPAGGVALAAVSRPGAAADTSVENSDARSPRRKRLVALIGGSLLAVAVTVGAVAGITALNQPTPAPKPVVTVPAEPEPSEAPPADQDTGSGGVVDDSSLTEEERKEAEEEQREREQEQRKQEQDEQKQKGKQEDGDD